MKASSPISPKRRSKKFQKKDTMSSSPRPSVSYGKRLLSWAEVHAPWLTLMVPAHLPGQAWAHEKCLMDQKNTSGAWSKRTEDIRLILLQENIEKILSRLRMKKLDPKLFDFRPGKSDSNLNEASKDPNCIPFANKGWRQIRFSGRNESFLSAPTNYQYLGRSPHHPRVYSQRCKQGICSRVLAQCDESW